MDSYQLRYALLYSLPIFTAVCAKDQLKLLNPSSTFAVVCNNESSTERGMHWVCFFKNSNTNVIEFFDSYGMGIDFYDKSFREFCSR